jgi:hypothetical protein
MEMQPRNSLKIVVKGSGPTVIHLGDEESPSSTFPPAAAVVQLVPEVDPFMVQIQRDDPRHAMVCTSRLFSLRD